jgi:NAD(P)-dependent dehydrogenase (short-subunit alcohol dehydrogenase family)
MAEVLIIGGVRGIGAALGEQLASRGDTVHVTSRSGDHPSWASSAHAADVTDEASIEAVFADLPTDRLDTVIVTAGLLHDGDLQPEKRIEHVDPANVARVMAVNATGPLLVAKHAMKHLKHGDRAVFAALSARVGSIGDNRLGGWYAYRASKAAQNMFTKTLSIEWSRRVKHAIVVGLHPGTVETALSEPFRTNVPDEKLFSPSFAAERLLAVLDGLGEDDSGKVFAWDGEPIPA